MTSAPVTSPPAQPAQGGAQAVRDRPREGIRSGSGQDRCYAFPTRIEVVASDVVIIGIVSVCHKDAFILVDPRYVSSYFSRYLDMPVSPLFRLFMYILSVGDSIIVECMYRSCAVTIGELEMRVDLSILSMVDFDVILGMDWLSPCYVILDCHAKTVKFAMLVLPRTEWRGYLDYVPSRVISYQKAQRMVGKGCLSYLDFVRDVGGDTPTIDYVPAV
ncbi:uncharacterized protein [Nicotiana tomentosiformis]|uniref:uncharacterized protein n=1 Tax=Nicotiana tomentosiformis TaxID=4098 RepID=UPI00388C5A60